LTLSASTTYWLVASGGGLAPYNWKADGSGIVPTGTATHAGALFDVDGVPPTSTSGILNSYAINATLVPEPTAVALLFLGLCSLMAIRRK
jgi:hypothetical protein